MGQVTSVLVASVVATLLAGMYTWRYADRRHDDKEWKRLVETAASPPGIFDLKMVEFLPAPTKRFFTYAIAPGTPLRVVSEITMEGKFSLGTEQDYAKMSAHQILAAPYGFIWKMQTSSFGGSDGTAADGHSWTRFRLFDLFPVARIMGRADDDHSRASFGRYAAEALVWSPAAALPQPGVVEWEPVNDSTARMIMTHGNLSQSVDITVNDDGELEKVVFPRWSNANKEKKFQSQPFGCITSQFKDFNGYRLPTHVEAGNHYGTDDYFPFFIAEVKDVKFPVHSTQAPYCDNNSKVTSVE